MCGQDHDGMSHLSRVRQPGGIAPLEMLGDIRIIGFASCIFTWDLSTENPHWFSINADFHLQEGVRSDERTPEAPPPFGHNRNPNNNRKQSAGQIENGTRLQPMTPPHSGND